VQSAIESLQLAAESWSAEDLVCWGLDRFHPRVAIASAFGVEGIVLIDMASRIYPGFRVFTLDTGFFFPETYTLIEQIERRYGIKVERSRPRLTPEEQGRTYGTALWSRDPDRCCRLRKVEPLRNKLAELRAWFSAIRRDQSPERAAAPKLGWDAQFGLVKINPLADWTSDEVWEYVRRHDLPYNPLHDRNYPSIGCTHCTMPVRLGENPRAGRWAGFEKTECGLHLRQ